MRVYLIRHGETELNRKRIVQGYAEVPLNDLGIAQATRLAQSFEDVRLDHIYASDLRRATMTATVLASHTGVTLSYDLGFRERNPGDLSLKPHEEAMPFFTELDFIPPNGEGWKEFDDRVDRSFNELIEREGSRDRHIAVVSHGMVCSAFMRRQLGYSREQLADVSWPNTALTTLDYDDGWRLIKLVDASHLEGLEAPPDPALNA